MERVNLSTEDGPNTTSTQMDVRDLLSLKYFQLSLGRIIFQLLLCVLGAAGNICLLVVCLRRKIKNSAMVYIGGLAVVDLFACLVVIPLQVRNSWRYYTYYDLYSCKVYEWFKMSTISSSCLLFMAVAVDRYRAICHPFTWRRTAGTRRPLILVISCIIFGLALMSPELKLIGLQEYSVNEAVLKFDISEDMLATFNLSLPCHVCEHLNIYDGSWELTVFLFIALALFLTLAVVCIVSYGRISWVMAQSTKKMAQAYKKPMETVSASPKPNLTLLTVSDKKGEPISHFNFDETKCKEIKPPDRESGTLSPAESGLRKHSVSQTEPGQPDSRQISVSKALMVVTIVFLLSWLPYWAINIHSLWTPHFHIHSSAHITGILSFLEQLFFLNNAVNPLVYVMYSREFRLQCKQLCREITRSSNSSAV